MESWIIPMGIISSFMAGWAFASFLAYLERD